MAPRPRLACPALAGAASQRPAVTANVPVMSADPYRDLLPLFPEHSSVSPDGELAIGGVGVRDLAERFGTPAYIVDEAGLWNQARRFKDGLAARHPDSEVVFASKSLPCLAVYKLFAAAGLSIDVAGAGELVMALAAGVSPERMYQHGNAKTTAELTMALEAGVGHRGGGQLRRHRPAGTDWPPARSGC